MLSFLFFFVTRAGAETLLPNLKKNKKTQEAVVALVLSADVKEGHKSEGRQK